MKRLAVLLQPQFLVYVAGGVLCAVIDIGLMQLLLARQVAAVPAASAGSLAGLVLNYLFHAKVTFGKLTSGASLGRFLCLVALNYGITLGLVTLSLTLCGLALPGKLLSLPVVAVNGYLLGRYWIFR